MIMKTGCICMLLLLMMPLAHAAESGSAIKVDELKSEPFRDAETLGALKVGDKVEIVKKQGGWLNVKSARGNGWVRMLSVRRGSATSKSTTSASALASLTTGRAGTGKVQATTGIRGLNEEELKAAKFDEAGVKQAESYATSRDEAQKFSAQGELKQHKVDYLPEAKTEGAK